MERIKAKGSEENGAVMFEIEATDYMPDSVMKRAGDSANAEIILQKSTNVLSVPENCVEITVDSAFVYMLDSANDKMQSFTRTPIKIGLSDGIQIEVKEGVEADSKLRGLEK